MIRLRSFVVRLDVTCEKSCDIFLALNVVTTWIVMIFTCDICLFQVTVVVKRHECASSHKYLTFVAYRDYLPSSFIDGSFEAGPDGSVFIDEVVANKHIEIYLRYIDTTIVIRQINTHFFSVAVKLPQEIVDATLAHALTDPNSLLPVQLCINSCPHTELIDYREVLVQTHVARGRRRQRADDKNKSKQVLVVNTAVLSRDVALVSCQRVGLVDYYLDSCVYDLMLTGDSNFTVAVQLAQSDEFRLVPALALKHTNRTGLNRSALAQYSATTDDRGGDVSAASGPSCSYLTLLFCVIFISHLNYIHKTTFVLNLLQIS